MQLHTSDKEKLSESNIVFKSKGLGQFFLNNNTVEDIKEEVDESFTKVRSELTKIFRPINFSWKKKAVKLSLEEIRVKF